MLKKIAWLIVGCLTVAALVLASCAPAVVEEEEEEKKPVVEEKKPVVEEKKPVVEEKEVAPEMVTLTLTKLDGTKVTKTVEKPKYGGTITTATVGSENWDPGVLATYLEQIGQYNICQPLAIADWTRGPSGTGEVEFSTYIPEKYFVPLLAESWEITSPTTYVFHLRQGIHYHDTPPANGREMVADDWVISLTRTGRLGGGVSVRFPPDKIYARDKYTLVIELDEPMYDAIQQISWQTHLYPPEIVKDDRVDWRDTCGTGPYMLEDYVTGSSAKLVKNPSYWGYDPFFPESKLPYADRLVLLYIADRATQLAALRTAKIDRLADLKPDEQESMAKTNPELLQRESRGPTMRYIALRADLKPFDDIRVRRALAVAIDRQGMLLDYWKGKATLPSGPLGASVLGAYTPLEELPAELRELYEYNPEKAKQLLVEAGYPDGFSTHILVQNTNPNQDEALMVKNYWEAIGVKTDLRIRTYPVMAGERTARKYETVLWGTSCTPSALLSTVWGKYSVWNSWWGVDEKGQSAWYEPDIDELQAEIVGTSDLDKRTELMKELNLLLMGKVYGIDLPYQNVYVMWTPWLKGYSGEEALGQVMSNTGPMFHFCWVDQDLKEAMTGKR